MPGGAPAPQPAPEPDVVAALAEALQRAFSTVEERPKRTWTPDFNKEFSHRKIPVYDGNYKSLRTYRQEIDLLLAICSEGAADQIVPHLINASTAEFKKKWVRSKDSGESDWTRKPRPFLCQA